MEQPPAAARTNQESYAKCHTEKFCGNCHRGAKPTTHTATWLAQHGKAAIRNPKSQIGTSSCQTCHTGSLCNACHRIEMPHPKDWESAQHQAAVKRDAAVCSSCHAQLDCLSCHQKKKPASHNFKCHDLKYCKDCHEDAG